MMMKTWIKGWIGASVLAITACGPLYNDDRTVTVGSNLVDSASALFDRSEPAQAAAGVVIDRAFIEAQNTELLRVSIISAEVTTVLPLASTNAGKTTWISPDRISLSFRDGLLIGTRGFGDDLMGADVSGAIASLTSGGNHIRTLDYLNGTDQITRIVFQCETVKTSTDLLTIFERSYQTTVFEETCVSENETFKNTYWRDRSGTTWQSRQWISPMVGYLGYQRL